MKKIISLLTVAILLVCALTGCGGNKETVATDGSTSMNKVIGALAESLDAVHICLPHYLHLPCILKAKI